MHSFGLSRTGVSFIGMFVLLGIFFSGLPAKIVAQPVIERFELVDQSGHPIIADLKNGATLRLSELGDQPVNIRAITNFDITAPELIGLVDLELIGPLTILRNDFRRPFTISGEGAEETLLPGDYLLTARPIGSITGEGSAFSINFSVLPTIDQIDLEGPPKAK